jgi:hypothetical protein
LEPFLLQDVPWQPLRKEFTNYAAHIAPQCAQANDKVLATKVTRDFLFALRRQHDCLMIVRIAAHKATCRRAEVRLNCVMVEPMLGFSVQGAFTSLIR